MESVNKQSSKVVFISWVASSNVFRSISNSYELTLIHCVLQWLSRVAERGWGEWDAWP